MNATLARLESIARRTGLALARLSFGLSAIGLLGVPGMGGLVESGAQAAQWARVTVGSIEVYDGPTKSHHVQRRVKRGTVLQASNYPTEGFYKVRLQDKTIGWVSSSALLLKGPATDGGEPAAKAAPSKGPASSGGVDELPPPLPE